MSFEFILRIIGMIVLAISGGFLGYDLSRFTPEDAVRTILVFSLVGALTGLVLTPYFTTRPARA
ncbi:MAG TPA: PIN domain nuclease, partial [Anaerolineales bacterium]|nr:PIN domain nuclease [Anaerolineales bacterium]